MVDPEIAEELKRTYNAINCLEEEKKSIAEDIKEEKMGCAKKTGMDVKDVNTIFRLVKMNAKGQIPIDKFKDYLNVLEQNSYVDETDK